MSDLSDFTISIHKMKIAETFTDTRRLIVCNKKIERRGIHYEKICICMCAVAIAGTLTWNLGRLGRV